MSDPDADSADTFLGAWLSAVLLGGLVLKTTLGWLWADPIAALGIAYLVLREGREACKATTTDSQGSPAQSGSVCFAPLYQLTSEQP